MAQSTEIVPASGSGSGTMSARDRAVAAAQLLQSRWSSMQPRQRSTWAATALVLAAICAGSIWWSSRTEWRPLFKGMDGRDLQQVEQQLGAAGISYRSSSDGGGVDVPVELVDKARMAIAAKGMPSSGRMGFEIFDKPNWVGSEFDEKVNYQRALEGELEHTIETLGAVSSARVHLVLPREALFASEERPATASVVLKLRQANMPREQVESIRSLVAGAVENLHADQVTLVDADGRTSFDKLSSTAQAHDDEAALEQKLVAMLEPLAGAGNVRATVNIRYDQGTEERTDEVYDPQASVPVSVTRSEQSSNQPLKQGGAAGTSSNTPAATATPPLLTADKKDTSSTQMMREESSSYAVTRHLLHTQQGPGRVQHIAAAIVVNDRMLPTTGKVPAWKSRSPEEIHRLEELAQAAVGFDAKRGDSVVVQNIAFSTNGTDVVPSALERGMSQARTLTASQPGLIRTGGVLVCLLALYLLIARPLMRQVSKVLDEMPAPPALALASETSPEALPLSDQARQISARHMLNRVHDHMRQEPQQSKRILESWIGASDMEMD